VVAAGAPKLNPPAPPAAPPPNEKLIFCHE
jgi:hypothetical protein